jgi:hypothetical protein
MKCNIGVNKIQFINFVAVKGVKEFLYGSLYFRADVYSVPFHFSNLPHVPCLQGAQGI